MSQYTNVDLPNFFEISSLQSVKHLQTRIRDEKATPVAFARYAKRLMTVLCEEAIAIGYGDNTSVTTPLATGYEGQLVDESNFVAISIIRAADSMLDVFLNIFPEAIVGKILIQRDEETSLPKLYYSKVPPLAGKNVVLLDPMLATGGSALEAIKILLEKGADIEKMVFINVVAAPEGVRKIHEMYPSLRIISGELDQGLNEKVKKHLL
jgi:uracil phosphoribosyltransferase